MISDGDQVFAAFRVSLDPTTPREARNNAEKYIESLKNAASGFFNICVVVRNAHAHCSDLGSAQVCTQLALSILDDWMNVHWNMLCETDQLKVRVDVLALLLNPPQPLLSLLLRHCCRNWQ